MNKLRVLIMAGLILACSSTGRPALIEGLVAYWKFDEGSGTTAYDLIGGNHGTIYGATWATGIVDGALSFDGVDDYVQTGTSDILDIDAVTIEAWVWQDGTAPYGTGSTRTVSLSTLDDGVDFKTGNDGKFIFVITHNDRSQTFDDVSITMNKWVYLVGTFEGNQFKMYKDGVLVKEKSATSSGIRVNNKCVYFATQSYAYSPFRGMMDEVTIWSRALTAEEIQQHYQSYFPNVRSTFDTGLDGWSLVGAGDLFYMNQDGNPGGFVKYVDVPDDMHPGSGDGWLVAPQKFLGDWSTLNERGTLSWDHIILQVGGDPKILQGYVLISGPAGSARCRTLERMRPRWRRFSVPIDEVAWNVLSGTWANLILNVTELKIRIEAVHNGASPLDIDGIDNVVLACEHTLRLRADLNYDGIVNFEDFAIMACEWLETEPWYLDN